MIFSSFCCCHSLWKSLFFLYQQNKSSESKVKFRQASNRCKRVLEASKLATKTKESISSQKLGCRDFGGLLIVFSTKINVSYLLYSTDQRCCLLHLIKQNYLLKPFLRTLIQVTLISLYLFSLLELILNCIIFPQLPRRLKRS